MNILFLTAFTPSEIGAAVKNTKIMLEKLSYNHYVDLCFFRYKNDMDYVTPNTNLKIVFKWGNSLWFKWFNILLFPFLYPQFTVRYNWWYMHKINALVKRKRYDVVVFDHSQLFLYAKFMNNNVHKILISHDVIAQRAQRAYSNLAYHWCLLSEKYSLKVPNSRIFTFSRKDCDLIKNLYSLESYVSHAYLEKNIIEVLPKRINDEFVMFGMWARADNLDGAIWFFNNVAQLLQKKIKIKIIGLGFPKSKLENLNSNVIVEYLGFVDNPYIIIANCKAVLAPIFTGAGLKAKVAESLACGTPVIGTDVAMEGLPDECSFGMFLANNEIDFANQVENFDFAIDERIGLKRRFLECFEKGRVPDYIDSINRCDKFNS